MPQERQRGAAARLVERPREQRRARRRPRRRRERSRACPTDSVQLVPGHDHESAKHLMRARGLVDVLIPRGGAGLIRSVVEESTVPVIETGVGNCHVYVDADADLDMAIEIILNAKTQRPERLQRGRDDARALRRRRGVPAAGARRRCRTRASRSTATRRSRRTPRASLPATDEDWAAEYLSLDLAVGVVGSAPGGGRAHPAMGERAHRGDRDAVARRRRSSSSRAWTPRR